MNPVRSLGMKAAHIRYEHKPFYGSSHSWAQRQLSGLSSSCRVLDVGSGSGTIGEALKEQGLKELYAVEKDAQAREHVKDIYKVIASDLSEFEGEKFDLILLLDVIEHVTDSEDFFSRALKMLSPGGTVLISIPNVAHWSVRLLLLFGIFDYHDRGIMDRTHYQFFTRKRVREMLRGEPSISNWKFDSSIEPIEFLLPEAIWNNPIFTAISRIRLAVSRVLPRFFAFQHLVSVRKSL